MTDDVPILKDEDGERPVPTAWRDTCIEVVDAFRDGDFRLARGVARVQPLSDDEANRIGRNIQNYGATLISLPPASWQTSICCWMGTYWEILVDLYTLQEGASDLVLFMRVRERDGTYEFEVISVHVP